MKISKKIYTLIVLIALLYVFKGYVYRVFVKYESIQERKEYSVHNSELISYIENSTINSDLSGIISIIDKSNKLTNEKLKFTSSKCDVDPNKLVNSSKTHCVGYAYFYASTCNYLLKRSKLPVEWKAKAYASKLYFLGVDIHKYFDSPFFKNHDFVIVENSNTGERIYIDPTISDYLGIDSVSIRSN
ncbi:hypothetical protein ATE84_4006 [Aquimarina sp. MAR_2010_214]|uniref:hypothetical protein n=1 Tax=Aquimarina sp. MAR_2010_214 TaxID=1250026 RepID=UPI000C703F75|nr:hypothetical protein [Aquimarina sp. MAR_2010_214]PKV51906.1 hypothetical protein ATE84_4006 [Aquimarina sp. MAR_2010_214]